MSSKVIEITNISDYDVFKRNHRRGIIFYGAEWCEACKEIMPLYTRIANKYYKRIAMAYADVERCKLDFSRVPVFVSFRKGVELNNMVGANKDSLKEFIKEAIEAESKHSNVEKQYNPEKQSKSDIHLMTEEKSNIAQNRTMQKQIPSEERRPGSPHDRVFSKPVVEKQYMEKRGKRQTNHHEIDDRSANIYREIEDIMEDKPRIGSNENINGMKQQSKTSLPVNRQDNKVSATNIVRNDYVEENHKIKSRVIDDIFNISESDDENEMAESLNKQNMKLKNLLMNDDADEE